jgi:hypothetical protein
VRHLYTKSQTAVLGGRDRLAVLKKLREREREREKRKFV